MTTLYIILYVLALVSFFVAAVGHSFGRVSLLALGLFFWALVPFIKTVDAA